MESTKKSLNEESHSLVSHLLLVIYVKTVSLLQFTSQASVMEMEAKFIVYYVIVNHSFSVLFPFWLVPLLCTLDVYAHYAT